MFKDDDVIDKEDRREDDRIMVLLADGDSPAVIDQLYCVDGLSAGDVERHLGAHV